MINPKINDAMMNRCNIVLFAISLLFSSSLIAGTIDVTKRGAKGDGVTDNTIIIQKAVEECSKKGGGTVLIPSGSYLIRPIELKSNVNLHLDFGTYCWEVHVCRIMIMPFPSRMVV